MTAIALKFILSKLLWNSSRNFRVLKLLETVPSICHHSSERSVFIYDILQFVNRDREHRDSDIARGDFVGLKIQDKCFVRNVKVLVRRYAGEVTQYLDISCFDLLLHYFGKNIGVVAAGSEQFLKCIIFPVSCIKGQ